MRSKTFIERIIHNPIIQTLVIFISGGWIILEITEYFIENFGLNENARNILLITLLSILPIALFLAWYLTKKEKGALSSGSERKERRRSSSLKRQKVLLPGTLIIIAIGITIGFRMSHQSKLNSAQKIVLPALLKEIESIEETNGTRNWNVYHNAQRLRRILRNDPEFIKLWDNITFPLTIHTVPSKAKIYAKPYSRPDTSWHFLGETPLLDFSFPKGLSRIKIVKPGFETQHDIIFEFYRNSSDSLNLDYTLFKADDTPENMVYIPGHQGSYKTTPFLDALYAGDIWMDRFEVSNQQYKLFIDDGGYTNPDYWEHQFVDEEDTLDFDIAIDRFKDKTGWPGPINWEQGDFPLGEEDIPVTGISWYEASAYAKYVDKELPTIFHWVYLSVPHASAEIVKFGNFAEESPEVGGTYQSQTRYGTYDFPGNVSEWVFNSEGSNRMIMGGNFREPTYWYNYRVGISPLTRNELIGFRCMRYINDTLRNELSQDFPPKERDFSNEEPVSDEVFSVFKELFRYEKEDLNSVIESRVETEDWIRETVFVDVPYEDTPMEIAVFLPANAKPPFQPVLYYPGLDARNASSTASMILENTGIDFFPKGGRAVIWPVYYSTFGRGDIEAENLQTGRQVFSYIMIDAQITCDYLDTRNDMDAERIAYAGVSWGGFVAPYILSIEDRIKLGILMLFGVQSSDKYPEFDQINYLPRVKIPMLLLAGRYDPDYSMKQQQAFYDFLGTPENEKEWKIYESTHYIPRKDLINESLNWLDKYFGPVNR
ncbi:MAG: SUMF1/EgtB/PvdO family nonheme iron enzyme [Bacteroidales bacterium]|nr:SUMF1/EgtB/PvdO family nonheme iron enzyme [Bacteroidales bacterium]